MPTEPPRTSRRALLALAVTAPALFALATTAVRAVERIAGVAPASLLPTPECHDGDDVTLSQTEGPYYTRNSPERVSLIEPGMAGARLVVTGRVLSTACQPVTRALLDFWQADAAGVYDNVGYRLRGHQFTDEEGRYTLETIMPGLYPGRTRHIHVKVQAPNSPVLTTQLYFPGEPANARDGIYNPRLVMQLTDGPDGQTGTFDFIVPTRS